jgi:hypothetical protein
MFVLIVLGIESNACRTLDDDFFLDGVAIADGQLWNAFHNCPIATGRPYSFAEVTRPSTSVGSSVR